jgi:ribosome-associated protein
MAKKVVKSGSEMLAEIIIKGIQKKKGKDIVCLNLKEIHNAVCDYYIVCHGNSTTQVNSIADSVDYEVKKSIGINPWHIEGVQNAEWILIDYADVVVHIFQEETREFYQIEKLWADAETTLIKSDY